MCFPVKCFAARGANAVFAYTHLLPSPYTVRAGRLVYGTDLVFGITDFFQVGTGLLRDLYRYYNVNAKLSFLVFPNFALALTGGYENYSFQDFAASNPDLKVHSWLPGAVAAFGLLPNTALFIGGNLAFYSTTLNTSGIVTSGFSRGARLESDLSWAYNPQGRGANVGNVLSAGVSYDVTFRMLGFGASHHWPGFQIGIHYYPAASQNQIQPILVGGGSLDL